MTRLNRLRPMLGLTLLLLGAFRPVAAAGPDLASAKALYASASYEEALSILNVIESSENKDQIEQYRALCLLALGRVEEAERSLERIILREPLYVVRDADVSPRLVTLFHDVRRRALPAAAADAYRTARESFDRGQFETASTQFEELLAITRDPDAAPGDTSFSELARLAEGFLKLSEAAIAPPPPPAPVAPPAASTPAPVYTMGDEGVTLPVAIEREFPKWSPASPSLARLVFRGLLEVIVNARGNVESASLLQPVSPLYDRRLLDATKSWRFRPAMKDGEPVRYRLPISIVLTPSSQD